MSIWTRGDKGTGSRKDMRQQSTGGGFSLTKAEQSLLGTDLRFYSDSHLWIAVGDTANPRGASCTVPTLIPAGGSYQAMCLLLSAARATQSHKHSHLPLEGKRQGVLTTGHSSGQTVPLKALGSGHSQHWTARNRMGRPSSLSKSQEEKSFRSFFFCLCPA